MNAPAGPIRYEVESGVATITLDDPSRRNALSTAVMDALAEALVRARGDDRVRVVVLASSHDTVWSAGGDLSGFTADVPLVHKHFAMGSYPELIEQIVGFPKPTICAANGHVLAGALGVALSCDLVIAKESATFGTPEITIGAFPFMIMALIFRNVPRKRTNELLLLGERIDANEARELGIVNRVVAADEFDDTVADWARKLAARSPLLMRMGKEAMREQLDMPLSEALQYLRAQLTIAQSTEDIHEGVTAFFEKRDPVWAGR